MASAHEITLAVYNLTLIPVLFLSVLFLLMSLVNVLVDRKPRRKATPTRHTLKELPFVSVQIPVYNDPVANRCIQHCLRLDYPRDKFEIIIVDDSTNTSTQRMMRAFADKHPGFVKYVHRDNREGYKSGALNNAEKHTKGDIIVIFDSDWMPAPDFLTKVVQPFADPEVAIVQTRQGFLNLETNIISRFSAYLLMIYHTIIMPINNKVNTVFFCGTAGALRRSAMKKVGGWNTQSITEDSDLSVRLLLAGYRTVYLNEETPSEVPDTIESFVKQQMRWTYGAVRVFFDNASSLIFTRKLTMRQKFMIAFMTLLNFAAPLVLLMTLFGMFGWFLGEPTLMTISDVVGFMAKFGIALGYLLMGGIALYKQKLFAREFKHFVKSLFSIALVLLVSNTYAAIKAALNQKLPWYCTPKIGNTLPRPA